MYSQHLSSWNVVLPVVFCIHISPFSPHQVVVLLIGTNNHAHTAEAVAKGIQAISLYIRSKQPTAHLLVLVSSSHFHLAEKTNFFIKLIHVACHKDLFISRLSTFIKQNGSPKRKKAARTTQRTMP